MAVTTIKINDASRYEYIINKLYRTIEVYSNTFPELKDIKKIIDLLLLETSDLPFYSTKLRAISDYLNQQAVSSYIVRHLYNNFSKEIQEEELGLQRDIIESEYFIQLPNN